MMMRGFFGGLPTFFFTFSGVDFAFTVFRFSYFYSEILWVEVRSRWKMGDVET